MVQSYRRLYSRNNIETRPFKKVHPHILTITTNSLWLKSNNLSGPIPSTFYFPNLEWLNLENNDLTGPIPVSFLSLPLSNRCDLNGAGDICWPEGSTRQQLCSDDRISYCDPDITTQTTTPSETLVPQDALSAEYRSLVLGTSLVAAFVVVFGMAGGIFCFLKQRQGRKRADAKPPIVPPKDEVLLPHNQAIPYNQSRPQYIGIMAGEQTLNGVLPPSTNTLYQNEDFRYARHSI